MGEAAGLRASVLRHREAALSLPPSCLGPVVVGRGERGKRWPFGAVARGLGIRTGGGGGVPLPRRGGERMAKARSKGDPRRAGEAVSVADGAGVWEGGGR